MPLLDQLFSNAAIRDSVATILTLAMSLAWLRSVDSLAHRGWLDQRLSRKIIHVGTGPLFVLCWTLFSNSPWARWAAALIPALITAQFAAVGLGMINDEAAVRAMTRRGDPRELLRGPLLYGIVFVLCTLVYWRNSSVGILALMIMCGGDGLADIVGRRWGSTKLPFNKSKSWAGSAAMLFGGFAFAVVFVVWFASLGYFSVRLGGSLTILVVGAICLATTLVEALPLPDVDNVTVTAVAVLLGTVLLQS